MIKIKKENFLISPQIVHRGVYNNIDIAENTLLAFEKAIEAGYSIELDVQRLKDNTIIVFHDTTLQRASGMTKKIQDCTYSEIKDIPLFSTHQTIPTLQQVLELVQGRVGILIEIKQDRGIGKIEKEVSKLLENYNGKFAIQSFSPLSILWFRLHKPRYIRGQLMTNVLKKSPIQEWLLYQISANRITDPDFLSCAIRLFPDEKIEQLRKEKVILGWTIKTEKEYEQYRKYCDNVIIEVEG